MSIDYKRPAPTAITIRPEPEVRAAATVWRKPIQKATLGDDDFSKQLSASQGQSGGATPTTTAANDVSFWGKDGLGLDDVIDLINPLQHIPIISTIYRSLTGDEIAAGPRLIGGGVLGGVIGAALSAADIFFEQQSGKDIGGNVMAMMDGDSAQTNVRQQAKNTSQQASHIDAAALQGTLLTPSLEPIDFSSLNAQPQATEVASIPAAQSPADEKDQLLKSLFDERRVKGQQEYAKTQGLTYSQAMASTLK